LFWLFFVKSLVIKWLFCESHLCPGFGSNFCKDILFFLRKNVKCNLFCGGIPHRFLNYSEQYMRDRLPALKRAALLLALFVLSVGQCGLRAQNTQTLRNDYIFTTGVGTSADWLTPTLVYSNIIRGDDKSSPLMNLGFDFVFEGMVCNTFSVHTNGQLCHLVVIPRRFLFCRAGARVCRTCLAKQICGIYGYCRNKTVQLCCYRCGFIEQTSRNNCRNDYEPVGNNHRQFAGGFRRYQLWECRGSQMAFP